MNKREIARRCEEIARECEELARVVENENVSIAVWLAAHNAAVLLKDASLLASKRFTDKANDHS